MTLETAWGAFRDKKIAVAAAWAGTHPEWTIRGIWCSGATP